MWNDALALCKQSDKLPSCADLQKVCITQAKKAESRLWLGEVSNIPLQQSVADLGVAFKNFFESRNGKRKGKKLGYPKFKKKAGKQTARFRKGGFSIKGNKVFLAKIGWIKTIWSRPLPSEPSSVTVIKDTSRRYFLSFVVEIIPETTHAQQPSVGIDLGIKTFAVLSTREKISSPDYSKLDRKIRQNQRKFSRRVKGSKRRERVRLKVAKLKAKQRDTRKDFLHKLSTRVVINNQVIALEDLNVGGMLKNCRLSRAISQAGWREFRTLCEAKSSKFSRDFRVINRWEPTSQVCSNCGYRWGKLGLSVREIVCLNCATSHCRDENAAKMIEKVAGGQSETQNGRGGSVRPRLEAVPVEASTHQEYKQLSLFDCLGITALEGQ